MTVQGMQQQLQSSVLMQLHLPPWGLTIEPAAEETELEEAGIVTARSSVETVASVQIQKRYAGRG